MREIKCIQGSPQWHALRLGIPCASEMEKVVTAKTWKPVSGEARRRYLVRLLTERIMDCPLEDAATPAMLHGTAWEARTRAAFEMLTGCDVQDAGFVTNDAGTVGASPDGFVGDDTLFEAKSPFKPDIHMGYALDPHSFKQEYWVQTQSQLYVCQRKETALVSYFATLPMVCVRVFPSPEFQEKLHVALEAFIRDLAVLVELAKHKGWIAPKADRAGQDDGLTAFGVSQADLEAHIAHLKSRGAL